MAFTNVLCSGNVEIYHCSFRLTKKLEERREQRKKGEEEVRRKAANMEMLGC